MPGPLVEERHNANHELLTKATRTPVGYSPRDRSAHSLAPHCRSPSSRRTAFSSWSTGLWSRSPAGPARRTRARCRSRPFDEHSGRGASISFQGSSPRKISPPRTTPLSAPYTAARASWFCTGRRAPFSRRTPSESRARMRDRRLPPPAGSARCGRDEEERSSVGDPDRQLLFPCIRGISVSPNPSHR